MILQSLLINLMHPDEIKVLIYFQKSLTDPTEILNSSVYVM